MKKVCACCQQITLKENTLFEICDNCGWQQDMVQEDDPDFDGGANEMSLNQAKAAYRIGKKIY